MKIILGAGNTTQPGWTSLEIQDLDIRRRDQWLRRFQPGTIDAVLTEHVLEHLDKKEAQATAENIFEFLKPGGYWRIAVPDNFNPNPVYHEWCSPTGLYHRFYQPFIFDQALHPAHQQFFDLETLSILLSSVGFTVRPLEWFDAEGNFRRENWSQSDGVIYRCHGSQYVKDLRLVFNFDNISLIVDAIKPHSTWK